MRFSSLIVKNVLRRPVRSALTGVGVAMAVGAVVSLLGIAQGLESSFVQLYENRDVDLITLRAGVTQYLTSSIDERIGERIAEHEDVARVTGGLMDVIAFPEKNLNGVPIQGWQEGSFLFQDIELIEGDLPRPEDGKVVLLGTVLAKNLGKKAGDTVEIAFEPFRVVGVFKSFNVFENGSAVVLLDQLQEVMGREGEVTGFQVTVGAEGGKKAAIDRVQQFIEGMQTEDGRPLKLAAMPTREHVESTIEIQMSHAIAWLTSVIALIIGTVGILNTMIMSVFERTREIGILRAIGWRKRRIMAMILGESVLMCLAGAVLGSVGAVLLIRWLATLPAASGFVVGTIAPGVVVQGFIIAIGVGVIGGIYPAYRGATLSPTEAIRHE